MALSKVVDAVKEILTCNICLVEAIDPRALTCQHTYCFKCLKLYGSMDENKKSLENNKDISCPTCRSRCPVPDGRIEALPTSFIFSQLKDATSQETREATKLTGKLRSTVLKCSSSECVDEVAVSYCKACHYICLMCAKDHKTVKILKKQEIINLDEAALLRKEELPVCLGHPEQTLQLYCEPCKTPICFLCHALNHAHHSCKEMKNVFSKSKEELKIVLERTTYMKQESQNAAKIIQSQFDKQEKQFKSAIQETSLSADGIRRSVKTKETTIKTDIKKMRKSQTNVLETEQEKITTLQNKLGKILQSERQLSEFGNPCDYVSGVPSLKLQLEDINNNISHSLGEVDLTSVREMISDLKVNTFCYILENDKSNI